MRRMGKRRKALAGFLAIVFCFSFAGMVYSAWMNTIGADNILTMGSYKASILEQYKVPAHVDPSQAVAKKVEVRNEGTVPILVRISVKKQFGTRKSDGTFVEDPALDPEVIEIRFHNTYWTRQDDGWYYYRDVLKAGETTKEPLMESYTLSAAAGNEYKGKEGQIVIEMETVQAQEDAAASLWGGRVKELGIVWPKAPEAGAAGVSFQGRDGGFSFTMDGTDLFLAFKDLQPGCARQQMITVSNQSQERAQIFLRAEETDQTAASEEQKELLRQLLEKYAVIEVSDQGRVLYQGAVCGQDGDKTMRSDISLGEFPAGSSRELAVKLSLSPEMDNRFQKLTGKVRWTFTASGEDGTILASDAPQTGDSAHTGLWTALLISSGAALLAVRKRSAVPEPSGGKEREHEISQTDR